MYHITNEGRRRAVSCGGSRSLLTTCGRGDLPEMRPVLFAPLSFPSGILMSDRSGKADSPPDSPHP